MQRMMKLEWERAQRAEEFIPSEVKDFIETAGEEPESEEDD